MEAVDQLITMYHTGKGVERDYEKAVWWQEKKIEHFQKRFQKDKNEENAHEVIWTMILCGDAYKDLAKTEEAKTKYKEAVQIVENYEVSSVKMRSNVAVLWNRTGIIYGIEGNLKKAKEYYEKSIAIDEEMSRKIGGVKMRYYLEKALDIVERLCEESPEYAEFQKLRELVKKQLDKISKSFFARIKERWSIKG